MTDDAQTTAAAAAVVMTATAAVKVTAAVVMVAAAIVALCRLNKGCYHLTAVVADGAAGATAASATTVSQHLHPSAQRTCQVRLIPGLAGIALLPLRQHSLSLPSFRSLLFGHFSGSL